MWDDNYGNTPHIASLKMLTLLGCILPEVQLRIYFAIVLHYIVRDFRLDDKSFVIVIPIVRRTALIYSSWKGVNFSFFIAVSSFCTYSSLVQIVPKNIRNTKDKISHNGKFYKNTLQTIGSECSTSLFYKGSEVILFSYYKNRQTFVQKRDSAIHLI